ncbi:hypothetical protein BJ741DRAFT_424741 [Chytriomyces cf. hyalinus JEL632]|nr:hypothetical protein BJ741DRAFT_424741 [Chytriomyces cf. hyalinus JEL632]
MNPIMILFLNLQPKVLKPTQSHVDHLHYTTSPWPTSRNPSVTKLQPDAQSGLRVFWPLPKISTLAADPFRKELWQPLQFCPRLRRTSQKWSVNMTKSLVHPWKRSSHPDISIQTQQKELLRIDGIQMQKASQKCTSVGGMKHWEGDGMLPGMPTLAQLADLEAAIILRKAAEGAKGIVKAQKNGGRAVAVYWVWSLACRRWRSWPNWKAPTY